MVFNGVVHTYSQLTWGYFLKYIKFDGKVGTSPCDSWSSGAYHSTEARHAQYSISTLLGLSDYHCCTLKRLAGVLSALCLPTRVKCTGHVFASVQEDCNLHLFLLYVFF